MIRYILPVLPDWLYPPPLGVDIPGGWNKRTGVGILDPLYIVAIAFAEDQRYAVLVVLDLLGLYGDTMTWHEKSHRIWVWTRCDPHP